MNLRKLLALSAFCILNISIVIGQEICNNAIDDDNDGLIDLNDDDCKCENFIPSSLIPNPSFEEMTCCPEFEAQLDCANDWIQASAATTDYVHECGILGLPFINAMAPLPFPDGMGAIGFRDGKPGAPEFKEFTGACLTQTMTTGTNYMLDFFVGFREEHGSTMINMGVFATTDCANLPFGNNDQDFGCPTNGPGWVQLGEMTYSGVNEWVNATFEFTADADYAAIAIGPSCDVNPDFELDPYFFFDRLVLAEAAEFGIPIVEIIGGACQDSLVLISSEKLTGDFQWYQDGIALPGETSPILVITDPIDNEGTYMIVVDTGTGCFVGDEYELSIGNLASNISAEICEGESYELNGTEYDSTGEYKQTLQAVNGCDSIVTLMLTVNQTDQNILETSICAGESVIIAGNVYTEAGIYELLMENQFGCDSLIIINIFNEGSCNDCFPQAGLVPMNISIGKKSQDLFELTLKDPEVIQLNRSEIESFVHQIIKDQATKNHKNLNYLLSESSPNELRISLSSAKTKISSSAQTKQSNRLLDQIYALQKGNELNFLLHIKVK